MFKYMRQVILDRLYYMLCNVYYLVTKDPSPIPKFPGGMGSQTHDF